jgi:hypothetical protein
MHGSPTNVSEKTADRPVILSREPPWPVAYAYSSSLLASTLLGGQTSVLGRTSFEKGAHTLALGIGFEQDRLAEYVDQLRRWADP